MEKFISLPESVYKNLMKQSEILVALHNAGVNNWEFYDDALAEVSFDEKKEENEGAQKADDSPDGNWFDKEGSR